MLVGVEDTRQIKYLLSVVSDGEIGEELTNSSPAVFILYKDNEGNETYRARRETRTGDRQRRLRLCERLALT